MFHRSEVSFWYVLLVGILGMLVVICVFHAAWATEADGELWTCKAEGVYTSCTSTRSLKPCRDYRAEGVGVAGDKIMASIQAEGTCSDSLMRMISLEITQGEAKVKTPCSQVLCERK
jgi:hypothetical protein